MGELFVNPWLLGGLALASAPIIIHLLNRRRFRVHEWAAMDFLLQAAVTNRRRLKFEDLILLALRVLVIVLFVFMVARPLVTGGGAGWREDERVVVLDDSFSMEVFTPTGAVFENARESAINQVQDAIGRGMAVSLRRGSRPDATALTVGRPVAEDGETGEGAPASVIESGSDVLRAVRELKSGDIPLRLGRAVTQLVEEAHADKSPVFRRVVLISDFRAVDWLSEGGDVAESIEAAFHAVRQDDMASRFGFQLVDVGRSDVENVAVTGLETVSDQILAGVPVKLRVEVTNFSSIERARIEGELEIGESDVAAFTPLFRVPLPPFESVPPGESASVEVDYTFDQGGQYLVRATLEKDQLARDDDSFLVVSVRDEIHVVIVDGDPGRDRFRGEAGFLAAALAPRGRLTTGVDVRVVSEPITADLVEDADVVFILNRQTIAASEWDVLEPRVRDGTGLAFFLGNRVDPDAYRPGGLNDESERRFLFAARLSELEREPTERPTIRIEDDAHPAFAVVAGVEGFSFRDVRFERFFGLEPIDGARVVARFDGAGGDVPAIVESQLGRGRVVIFNTTADRDWSDWPTDPSYVIVLQEWVRYLTPRRGSSFNITAGDEISWRVTPGKIYDVETPLGDRHPVRAEGDEPVERLSFAGTSRAGFYRLLERDRPREDAGPSIQPEEPPMVRWYACRRPARESDLTPLGEARLRELLEAGEIKYSIGQEVDVDAFREEREGELWRWLAIAAGLILLTELAVAWWFGRT